MPPGVSAAIIASAAVLSAQTAPQRPIFRGGTNFVLVDAYPARDGRIVEGLTAADFQILEDGKPQTIDSIEFIRIEPRPEAARRDPNTQAEALQLAADPHNRVFVVYLDRLHTNLAGSHSIRAPLVDALNRIISPDDLFGVTTQDLRPKDLVFGRRLLSIEEQLTKYWAWGERQRLTRGPGDPFEDQLEACFHYKHKRGPAGIEIVPWIVDDGPVRRYLDEILIERRREERTIKSLEENVAYLASIREARTVLLLVSDGWVLFPPNRGLIREPNDDVRTRGPLAGPGQALGSSGMATAVPSEFAACIAELERLSELDNASRFRDLIAQAARTNVSFYPIAAGGLAVFDAASAADNVMPNPRAKPGDTILGRDSNRMRGRVESLRTVAENTNGLAVVNTNDLGAGLQRIVDDVSAYYLLGYYSTNTRFDGRFRRIEVKAKPPGLTVRARRGYLAPTEAPAAGVAPGRASSAGGAVPVEAALAGLGQLRETSDLFLYGAVSADEVALVVELASRQIARGVWPKGADVVVDATDAQGAKVGTATARIDAGARSALLRLAVVRGAGPWRANARVSGGTEGSLEERVEIRAVPGTLVGAPLYYRATPAPASPLRAVADLQYRRTERVHIEWSVLAALDRRDARLLGRNGQPLPLPVNVTEREVAGRAMLAVDLTLAPLTAGDYVIELTVGSGATTERTLVAIRVGQ